MKTQHFLLLFCLFCSSKIIAQANQRDFIFYLPAKNTTINGLGIGLAMQPIDDDGYANRTIVNGLSVEVIGMGFVLPMAGGPIDYSDSTESIPKYTINGLAISPGGVAGHDIVVHGVNISGIATLNQEMHGVSCGGLANICKRMKGVSIGGLGNSIGNGKGLQIGAFQHAYQMEGVQIGLVNQADSMHGVQIGLLNRIGNQFFPFINFNFKRKK
jgi:hypothetical protein